MKGAVLLLALLIAPLAAAAGSKKDIACREGKSFYDEIYNCGQNKVAAGYAEGCSSLLLASAKAAGGLLAGEMTEMQKLIGSDQTAHMNDAKARLRLAVRSLEVEISSLQTNTAVIAEYPKVMIDYPGAKDDETSAGCFSPAFNKIQDIVTNLDQEIVRAKAARDQALAFLDTLGANTGDMTTVNGARLPAAADKSAKAAPKAPGILRHPGYRESDISGTKPEPKK